MGGRSSQNRHVVAHPDGGWAVRRPGSTKASARTKTQDEAVGRAKDILRRQGGGEVRIHGRDGRIRDADTVAPAHDPRRSRG